MKSKHLVAHLLDTLTTDTFVDTSWAWTCSLKGWNNLCMAPRASFTSQILVILKCMELILWLDFRISIRMISQHCKSETTEHVSGTCPTSQGSQSQTCLHKIVLSICLLLFHVISLHTYIISQKKTRLTSCLASELQDSVGDVWYSKRSSCRVIFHHKTGVHGLTFRLSPLTRLHTFLQYLRAQNASESMQSSVISVMSVSNIVAVGSTYSIDHQPGQHEPRSPISTSGRSAA